MDRLVLELKSESKATSIPVAANDVNDDDVAATSSMMVITFHQKHNSNHYELVLSMFNFLVEFFNLELLARSKLNFIKALACLHIELRTFVQRSTRPQPYQLWKHHFLSHTGSHVLIGACPGRLASIARGNNRATLKREKNLLMLR